MPKFTEFSPSADKALLGDPLLFAPLDDIGPLIFDFFDSLVCKALGPLLKSQVRFSKVLKHVIYALFADPVRDFFLNIILIFYSVFEEVQILATVAKIIAVEIPLHNIHLLVIGIL